MGVRENFPALAKTVEDIVWYRRQGLSANRIVSLTASCPLGKKKKNNETLTQSRKQTYRQAKNSLCLDSMQKCHTIKKNNFEKCL